MTDRKPIEKDEKSKNSVETKIRSNTQVEDLTSNSPEAQTPNTKTTSSKAQTPSKGTTISPSKTRTPSKETSSPSKTKTPSKSTPLSKKVITPEIPTKSNDKSNNSTPSKNTTPSKNATVIFKSPSEKVINYTISKRIDAIIDNSPIPSTLSLVQKWEKNKEEQGDLNSMEKVLSKKETTIEKKANSTVIKINQSTETTSKSSTSNEQTPLSPTKQVKNVMEETKMTETIPELTRKFSFKENRIREAAKNYNKKANNVNTDLKNKEVKNVKLTVKNPVPANLNTSSSSSSSSSSATTTSNNRKRVFTEDDNDEENKKSKRSKRLHFSDLTNSENSLWRKLNSSINSLKSSLTITRQSSKDESETESSESSLAVENSKTPLIRINEPTCLNIFNPSVRSSMPMRLRIRRKNKSENLSSSSIHIPFFSKGHPKPNWTNRLFMVIGNEEKFPKLFEVPSHWTSLSSQMVYLLNLSGEAIIQYNGSNSQKIEREYAQRVSKRLMLNENIPDLFEIDQDVSYVSNTVPLRLFWKAMGLEDYSESERRKTCTKNDKIKLSVVLEEAKRSLDIEKAIYIYRINEQTKSSDLIHCGTFPTYKCLNSSVSMIFDFVGEIYLWQGKNSSLNARSLGIKFAQKIFSDYSRPSWATLKKINEGHEPVVFQEKFDDSYLFF